MKLTVLGCGDAFGNGGRNNTSFLLTHKNEHVLMDCGAATLVRLKQESIALEELSTIILSHFHGDHFGGVPFFLISSLFEKMRKSPLAIIGPPGVESKVLALQELMYPGTSEKLDALDISFHEYDSSKPLVVGDKSIESRKVEHSPPSNPHGFRLRWAGKVIGFSGDSSWTDNLVPLSSGADLFICDCNFLDEAAFGHLSYKELLSKEQLLNCENIWLSHMGNKVLELQESRFKRLEDGMKLEF